MPSPAESLKDIVIQRPHDDSSLPVQAVSSDRQLQRSWEPERSKNVAEEQSEPTHDEDKLSDMRLSSGKCNMDLGNCGTEENESPEGRHGPYDQRLDSPLSFHGQHSEFERKHLEKAAKAQVDGHSWSHPKMTPYLDQDARNAQHQIYGNQQAAELEIEGCMHGPALPGAMHHTTHAAQEHYKKRRGRHRQQSLNEEKPEEEARSSDADFSEDKTASTVVHARRRRPRWKFWKQAQFWKIWMPIFISVGFFTAAGVLFVKDHNLKIVHFKLYRYGFFLGSLYPVWWAGSFVTHCIVLAVECAALTKGRTMYYLYGVRKPLASFLRIAILIGVYIGCFRSGSSGNNASAKLHNAYIVLLKFLACVLLFRFGFVLAKFAARAMSTHFHQRAYFDKMRIALQKEVFLDKLTTPIEDLPSGKAFFCDQHGKPNAAVFKRNVIDASNKKYKQLTGTDTIAQKVTDKISVMNPELLPEDLAPWFADVRGDTSQAEEAGQTRATHRHNSDGAESDRSDEVAEGRSCVRRSLDNSSDDSDGGHPADQGLHARLADGQQRDHLTPGEGKDEARSGAASQNSNQSFWRWSLKHKAHKPSPDTIIDAMGKRRAPGTRGKKDFIYDNITKLQAAEKHLRRNKIKVSFADQIGHQSHGRQDPKRLAYALFFNIKPYEAERNYVTEEDVQRFFPSNTRKSRKAFAMLDHYGKGQPTLRHVRLAVEQISQERKDLAATLKDAKTIVGKLEILILIIIQLIFVLIYLILFSVNVSKVWITASTILVAFSFIFSKTISDLFETIIFLFCVQPFDNGDGILLGTTDGALHVVEEVALQSCLLNRWDGAKVYYPTHTLARMAFINVSRSGLKWESFIFYIDMSCPSDSIDNLRAAIRSHTRKPDSDLSGRFVCYNYGAGNPLKLRVGVYFEHSTSGTDLGRLDLARHKLFMAICEACKGLGLKYSMPAISKPADGFDDANDDDAAAQLEDEVKRPFLGNLEHHERQKTMAQPESEVGHLPWMPLQR